MNCLQSGIRQTVTGIPGPNAPVQQHRKVKTQDLDQSTAAKMSPKPQCTGYFLIKKETMSH